MRGLHAMLATERASKAVKNLVHCQSTPLKGMPHTARVHLSSMLAGQAVLIIVRVLRLRISK